MDSNTRQIVVRRARNYCEYCAIAQVQAPFREFHVEHIIAKQHGGTDGVENLCLACDRCNAYKGPNLAAIDPDSGDVVTLFHPRRDRWHDHFALRGAEIVGRTARGRATVRLLHMNDNWRISLRAELITLGEVERS
jgi:hypothetical protein